MYDNPTQKTGVSLPTSVNERASDTLSTRGFQSTGAQMITSIIASKCGNKDVNCYLADGKAGEEIKCKHSLYCTG